jgi:hypothetical protein
MGVPWVVALLRSGKNFLVGRKGVPQGGVLLGSKRNISAWRMGVLWGVERTYRWGKGALPRKGSLPHGDMSPREGSSYG